MVDQLFMQVNSLSFLHAPTATIAFTEMRGTKDSIAVHQLSILAVIM